MISGPELSLRPLAHRLADAEAYRALRLEALSSAPSAFGSSYEEESRLSVEDFLQRIPVSGSKAIFGAFMGDDLVGMAGFSMGDRIKDRHKGLMWSVFVKPEWRAHGIGRALVQQVIDHAAEHVLVLHAAVTLTNEGARRTYHKLGFKPYGVEPKALRVDGVFYDEELLSLEFPKA